MSSPVVCLSAALLSIAVAVAAEPVPVLSLTVPDATRTAADLAAGPGRSVLALPQYAAWRDAAGKAGGLSWRFSGAGAVRAALAAAPGEAGQPVLDGAVALEIAPGQDPSGAVALQIERRGSWLLAGLPGGDMTVPERTPVERPFARVDAALHLELAGGGPLGLTPTRILAALGVSTVDVVTGLAEGATVDTVVLQGRLPLRPIDPAALAGMPAQSVAILALGIDGPALGTSSSEVAVAAGFAPALVAEVVKERTGTDLAAIAASLDGTIVVALLPGDGFAISLPAGAPTDALFDDLLRREHFEDAERVQREARSVSASLRAVVPFPTHIRRTETRWLLSSDPQVLGHLADPEAAPFPVERFGGMPEGAVVLAAWDGAGASRTLAPWLAQLPHPLLRDLAGVVRAAGPALPGGRLQAVQAGDQLVVTGGNGPGLLLLGGLALADVGVPALAEAWRKNGLAVSGPAMRRIIDLAIAFSSRNQNRWPVDLAELAAWAKDGLAATDLAVPGRPGSIPAYCYVPPVSTSSDLPVLVQDPALHGGSGSLVGYADGQVKFFAGQDLWRDAKRLAELATSAKRAIERSEWTTLPKVF